MNVEAEKDVRTKNNIMVFSEVSRCYSKPGTSRNPKVRANAEVSQKDEGRNVRRGGVIRKFRVQQQQRKHFRELPVRG